MMKVISENKNLLTNIAKFSDFDGIMSLKDSKKAIKIKLNPKSNEKMNDIFLYQFLNIFRTEEDYELYVNKEETIINLNINFEKKIKEVKRLTNMMKTLGNNIYKSLDFIYKYHIYLPDLSKHNRLLEFINSSIFMDKLYNYKMFRKWESNYYNKYINEEYMNDTTGNKKIKTLRERQYFEKDLLAYKELYKEIEGNPLYKRILIDQIFEYNYSNIKMELKGLSDEELQKLNPIVFFMWFNISYFKLYLISVYSSIIRFKDSWKTEKFLKEFIKQHNNVLNVILFIDSSFNNINIIMNYTNKFMNKDNDKKNKTFSIMKLFLKMYRNLVFNKIISLVLEKLDAYFKNEEKRGVNIFEEKKEKPKMEEMIIESDDICDASTEDNSDKESEDEDNASIKNIIENLGNCILDMELDEDNVNSINHSGIILGENYSKYETLLIEIVKRNIERNLEKDNDCAKLFEDVKYLIEADKNPKRIISRNLKIINRTKKKLMEIVTKIFADYTGKKFNVFNKFYVYDNYQEDYSEFSEESENQIKKVIEEEENKIRNFLITSHKNVEGIEKIVDDYINNNGDNIIAFAKRLIYFYSKENQFYKDLDSRIHYVTKKIDDC